MQNKQTFHARRIFAVLGALAALALAGCASSTVTNMTPSTLAVNPSQTYTITALVKPSASNVIPGSETVKIIIGGQAYKMTKTPNFENVYEFDYKAPAGVSQIAYYFLVEYNITNAGVVSPRLDYSPLQHANIVDRDTTGLSANRGPVGARVAIAGRGFKPNDSVFFDSTPVRPTFESQNSLSFFVPSLEANRSYTVSVGDAPGKMTVGSFRIDPSGNNAAGAAPTGGYTMASNASANANPPSAYANNPPGAYADYTTSNATTTYTTPAAAPVATTYAPAAASTTTYTTRGGSAGSHAFGSGPASSASMAAASQAQADASAFKGNNLSINQPTNDITVSPSEITVHRDDYVVVKFITPQIVTGQPLVIDVTTDIPASVIMPEVYVKPGSNVGSVNLKGGAPGKGFLYVRAPGYARMLTVPITVK